MNTTINPTLSFPVENPGGMVTFSSGAWTDTKTYVGTFDVQDLNYNLANIDIGAASGKSGTGVFQVDGVVANVFSITTSITGIITVDDSGGADYTSISAAVAAAPDGALIMVADGTYNENLLLGSKAVVIKGNTTTPGSVILHGTGTSSTLTIENSAKKIDLQGMIIENGIGSLRDFTDANKHGQIGYYGGGVIIAAASNVSFSYVWVRNNTVGQYAPFHNGGSGGGIYIGRSSTVKITNCKIYSNTADAYRGAGICVDKSNVTIKTTDINNNSGSRYGGGIAAYDATIIFDTVNIFSNACGSVQSRGGGYYFHKSASSITLGSCSGNSAITNPQLEIY
jgi:hypothetical protein